MEQMNLRAGHSPVVEIIEITNCSMLPPATMLSSQPEWPCKPGHVSLDAAGVSECHKEPSAEFSSGRVQLHVWRSDAMGMGTLG